MKEKQTFFDNFIYKLQAFGLLILEKFFLAIGIKTSSFIGGFLLTIFGPFTPPTITAMKNIKSVMPELTFFQRLKIVFGMWNNLGRDLGEFVNFNCKNFNNIENYVNIDSETDKILKKIKNDKNGSIVFTAHFGNWEILPTIFNKYNIPTSAIYRAMNNKYANEIILKSRENSGIEMIEKGSKGVAKLVRGLKNGRKVIMLVDQRLSNGIIVPFFNKSSQTSNATAVFAIKHHYKVYSAVIFRRSFSCYFDVKIREFDVVDTGNFEEDVKATTIKINQTIENWIKTKPEQWFWVHKRWKKR